MQQPSPFEPGGFLNPSGIFVLTLLFAAFPPNTTLATTTYECDGYPVSADCEAIPNPIEVTRGQTLFLAISCVEQNCAPTGGFPPTPSHQCSRHNIFPISEWLLLATPDGTHFTPAVKVRPSRCPEDESLVEISASVFPGEYIAMVKPYNTLPYWITQFSILNQPQITTVPSPTPSATLTNSAQPTSTPQVSITPSATLSLDQTSGGSGCEVGRMPSNLFAQLLPILLIGAFRRGSRFP